MIRERAFVVLSGVVLAGTPAFCQDADDSAGPRLCVLIVVDQLIPEQLTRLEPWLDGGLARLLCEGRVYQRAQLAHGLTFTAPGYTSAGTGVWPSNHGVVANSWFGRDEKRSIYCYEDDSVRMVTSAGTQHTSDRYRRSPKLALVPGIAGHLRAAHAGARTVSISSKDRAAVGLAGRGNELSLWWDSSGGEGFVSSTWYVEFLPEWVRSFNAGWKEKASGFVWETTFDGELRGSGTAHDDRDGEYARHGERSMPRTMTDITDDLEGKKLARLAREVYDTPLGDAFVGELALRAIDGLSLGADETPDLLALGFSSTDTAGHLWGPYSVEVTDVVLRLDDILAGLFEKLDQAVGEGRWVCALSSDHGVLELPEELRRREIGGVRVSLHEIHRAYNALREHVASSFGENVVLANQSGGIYLDQTRMAELELDAARIREEVARFILGDADYLARAYTLEEIEDAIENGTDDPWLLLASRSYEPGRSPDVFYQGKPWHLLGDAAGTTHGSPYTYDRRIPLIFHGPGFEPERRQDHVSSCDIVPTLLRTLGIDAGFEFDGHDLTDE